MRLEVGLVAQKHRCRYFPFDAACFAARTAHIHLLQRLGVPRALNTLDAHLQAVALAPLAVIRDIGCRKASAGANAAPCYFEVFDDKPGVDVGQQNVAHRAGGEMARFLGAQDSRRARLIIVWCCADLHPFVGFFSCSRCQAQEVDNGRISYAVKRPRHGPF